MAEITTDDLARIAEEWRKLAEEVERAQVYWAEPLNGEAAGRLIRRMAVPLEQICLEKGGG